MTPRCPWIGGTRLLGRARSLIVLAVLLPSFGCSSTTYVPRADGRITFVMRNGMPEMMKDGRSMSASPAQLAEIVADDPLAASHARECHRRRMTGLVFSVGSLASLIGGAVLISPRRTDDGGTVGPSDGRAAAGGALLIAGFALLAGSLSQGTSASAHCTDAVNIYNDRVDARIGAAAAARALRPAGP